MYAVLEQYLRENYLPEHHPTLAQQLAEWRASKPLSGLAIIDSTPLCRNTTHKYLNLLEAGAALTVALNPIVPKYDAKLLRILQECGVEVVDITDSLPKFDIVMDCGALLIQNTPRIGYVELTRSHSELYAGQALPAFIADSGRVKRIETFLGTGESYFRAMAHLGYPEWQGHELVVFGSGKVGQGIIHYANRLGARVSVVTDTRNLAPRIHRQVTEIIDLRDRANIERAITKAYAIVTATGVDNALAAIINPDILINSPALLANMGATDEFGQT